MDTQNSQKRSPRSSTKSKRSSVEPEVDSRSSFAESNPAEFEDRYDRSFDLVECVRRAREAAHKKMNAFSGNLDDYVLVRKIVGQKSIREQQAAAQATPVEHGQAGFDFEEKAADKKEPSK